MYTNKYFSKSLIATSLLLALVGCSDDDKPNVAPTANAGADFSVDELTTVTLSGEGIDTDGSIASYSWIQTAGTPVTIENANAADAQFLAPNVRPSETLTFELTVTDDDGEMASDSVDVEIVHINTAPVVNTADQSAAEKSSVELTAVAEDDSMIVSYTWAQVSGETVQLSGVDSETLSFVAPSVTEDTTLTFSLTVEDDEGETATQNVDVVITQTLVSFTIEGLITDAPIANANIVFQVGDKTETATADSAGLYSVGISVDDDEARNMVSITATGVGSQSHAKLTSILGTVGALEELVNEDGIIDSEALFSVNVTNVTTANVALMQRENLGAAIDSDEALKSLSLRVSAQEKFELATAIKVAIDLAPSNANLSLPEGITDTLALAQNTEVAQVYVESLVETAEFEIAYQDIINDPELIDKDSNNLTQSFFITDFDNPLLSYPGKFVKINADGSASYQNYAGQYESTWVLTDNELTLSFADGAYTYSTGESVSIDGSIQTVNVEVSVLEMSFVQLENTNGVLTLEQSQSYVKRYPNGELPDSGIISDPVVQQSALTLDNISTVELPTATDTGIALPIPQQLFTNDNFRPNHYALSADTFSFHADGTGNKVKSDKSFNWALEPWDMDSSVNTLSITFDDGVTIEYLKVTQQPDVNLYAVWGSSTDSSTLSFKLDAGDTIEQGEGFDVATVPGIYSYSFDGDSTDEFWWELWDNGRAYSISTVDSNGDGSLSSDEVSVMYGNWSVNESGELIINRYRSSDYSWPGCFELSSGCYHYNQRTWTLFSQVDDVFHITNRHEFDYYNADGNGGFDGVFDYDVIDNRRISKTAHRPVSVELPHLDTLPALPPLAFTGLLDPSVYFNITLYGVEQNEFYDLEVAQLSMQLNSDGTFSFIGEDAGDATGEFSVMNDNSVELVAAEGSALQVFLIESSDVIIAANEGYPTPFFMTEALAEGYEEVLRNGTSVAPVSDLNNLQLVMVELSEQGIWQELYVMFDGETATLYTDDTYTTVRVSVPYVTNDDGSIFESRMYASLVTEDFTVLVSEQDSYLDFNYMFVDANKARAFTRNANALLSKVQMSRLSE